MSASEKCDNTKPLTGGLADRAPQQHARVAAGPGLNHTDITILLSCKHRIRLERTQKNYHYDGFKVAIRRI